MTNTLTIKQLLNTLPQSGVVTWIGLRPSRREAVKAVTAAQAIADQGLDGDHYAGRSGKRQVTLIQAEHLEAMASFLGRNKIDPALLRRNIVVSEINLLALKDKRFQVGACLLQMTGLCHPCSRMEEALGTGGYNAVRGHGGITARILEGGMIRVGDRVSCVVAAASSV